MTASERINQILTEIGDQPAEMQFSDGIDGRDTDALASLVLGREIHTPNRGGEIPLAKIDPGFPAERVDSTPARQTLKKVAGETEVPYARPLGRSRVPVLGVLINLCRKVHRRLVGYLIRPIMDDYRQLNTDMRRSVGMVCDATEGLIRNTRQQQAAFQRAVVGLNQNDKVLAEEIRNSLYNREDGVKEALQVLIEENAGLRKQILLCNEAMKAFRQEQEAARQEQEAKIDAFCGESRSAYAADLSRMQEEADRFRKDQEQRENGFRQEVNVRLEQLELSDFRMRKLSEKKKEAAGAAAGPAFESMRYEEAAGQASELPVSDNTYELIDYFEFENMLRGSRKQIAETQKQYLPWLRQESPVFDLGCGRGELLEMLRENGVPADGAELYQEYADFCQDRGLDVVCGDGIQILKRKEDNSLGGVTAMQVIEHLTQQQIMDLCVTAYRKLKKGKNLILETPNPACVSTFTNSFYMDPSHMKPIHPKTMEYLLKKAGFSAVQVIYTESSRVGYRLPLLNASNTANLAEFNDGINLLSDLIFGSQDYAVIATK